MHHLLLFEQHLLKTILSSCFSIFLCLLKDKKYIFVTCFRFISSGGMNGFGSDIQDSQSDIIKRQTKKYVGFGLFMGFVDN